MKIRMISAALLLAALSISSSASALDWPFRIESGDTLITIYMPQVETFEGDMITARSAVSISTPETEAPVFGAVWFESYALTDRGTCLAFAGKVNLPVLCEGASKARQSCWGLCSGNHRQSKIPPLPGEAMVIRKTIKNSGLLPETDLAGKL